MLLEYDVRGASIRKTGTSVELRYGRDPHSRRVCSARVRNGRGIAGEEDQSAKAGLLALYSIIFIIQSCGWENLARDVELPISI